MCCARNSRLHPSHVGTRLPSHAAGQAAQLVQLPAQPQHRAAYQPMKALQNWMPSRIPMSSQFVMAASTMMAIQIMMGMGWMSCKEARESRGCQRH